MGPSSCTIAKAQSYFDVSKPMVGKANELKSLKGSIVNFYQSDEFSRMCPEKKEYVSVKIDGVCQYMQKQLILVNLKEMHIEYCKSCDLKIGFSKFWELRPKWCVTVCVCDYRQNAKLLISALPTKIDYKELLKRTVCDKDNRNYMLHGCEYCPSDHVLKTFLTDLFENEDQIVNFEQWKKQCDKAVSLISLQLPVEEFVAKVSHSLEKLSEHHFRAKKQGASLKDIRGNLVRGTTTVLMDFAENYNFVMQDTVRFHWNNTQATLNPFEVYCLNRDCNIQCWTYCIISDRLKHDVNAIYSLIKSVITNLKELVSSLNKCIYFSDGAGPQDKNQKNFTNLCHHEADFTVNAEWDFFATSHGRSM